MTSMYHIYIQQFQHDTRNTRKPLEINKIINFWLFSLSVNCNWAFSSPEMKVHCTIE